MRALFGLTGFASAFLLGPALADVLGAFVPGLLAGALGWSLARGLVPFAQKLQSEDAPREG